MLLDEGERRFYDGDYDGALAKFAEAISLDADDAEAYYLQARSLFYLGRDEEADTWIQAQVALRPKVDADATVRAKLQAAIQLALISTENHLAANNRQVDSRFLEFFGWYLEDVTIDDDKVRELACFN